MNHSFKIIITLSAFIVLCLPVHLSEAGPIPDRFLYPEYSKTISMDFKEADLNDVLKIFSQQANMNFIASDDIAKKKITLFLDKVPVEEALEYILKANNLTYEIKEGSNIFVVKSLGEPAQKRITRVYQLRYATVLSSKINDTFTIDTDDTDNTESSSSSSSYSTSQSKDEDTGIVAALESVVSKDGKIIEDPRTNSVIVTDYPAQFPLIEQTIARLDVPIPQVLIEVEMLDISKATADLLGVKAGATPLTFTGAQRDILYPWNQNDLLRKGYAFEDAEYRVGTIDASGLSAILQMLRTVSDTKNLARPRILTLNNETAQIKISTNEAIGIKSITQSAEGSSVLSVEAERVQTGVFLTVTPQVNLQTKEITMAIAPRVIEAQTGGTFQGQTFRDPEERGSKSVLRITDGETIIIGGLLRGDTQQTRTKVPFFSDIPLIGAAFRHKDKSNTDRELVIFITPHIVPEDGLSAIAMHKAAPFVREQEMPEKKLRVVENALKRFDKN